MLCLRCCDCWLQEDEAPCSNSGPSKSSCSKPGDASLLRRESLPATALKVRLTLELHLYRDQDRCPSSQRPARAADAATSTWGESRHTSLTEWGTFSPKKPRAKANTRESNSREATPGMGSAEPGQTSVARPSREVGAAGRRPSPPQVQ